MSLPIPVYEMLVWICTLEKEASMQFVSLMIRKGVKLMAGAGAATDAANPTDHTRVFGIQSI